MSSDCLLQMNLYLNHRLFNFEFLFNGHIHALCDGITSLSRTARVLDVSEPLVRQTCALYTMFIQKYMQRTKASKLYLISRKAFTGDSVPFAPRLDFTTETEARPSGVSVLAKVNALPDTTWE